VYCKFENADGGCPASYWDVLQLWPQVTGSFPTVNNATRHYFPILLNAHVNDEIVLVQPLHD